MIKYIFTRIVAMVLTLFLIVTISFFCMRTMPGNLYNDPMIKPEIRAAINEKYHLNKPVYVQYFYFIKGLVVDGDWGTSIKIQPGVPAFQILRTRIPISMWLNLVSLVISIPIGITLGAVAALKRNKASDDIISLLVIVGISIPAFVFASLLQYFLAYKLGWFPIIYKPSNVGLDYWMAMALPILALSLGPIATITRYLRGELSETLSAEFMLLTRTKGLTHRQAILRHAFRNSCVPLIDLFVSLFVGILGGSMVIENIFAIPGVGDIMVDAINALDHPLAIAVLIFYSAVSLMALLLIDLLYGIVDPRIRIGAKR